MLFQWETGNFLWVRRRSVPTVASNNASSSKGRARSERRRGIDAACSLSTCASAEIDVGKRRTQGCAVIGITKLLSRSVPQIPRLNSGQVSLTGATVVVLGSTMICLPMAGLWIDPVRVWSTEPEVTDRALVVAAGKGHSGHGEDRRGSKCDFDHFQ